MDTRDGTCWEGITATEDHGWCAHGSIGMWCASYGYETTEEVPPGAPMGWIWDEPIAIAASAPWATCAVLQTVPNQLNCKWHEQPYHMQGHPFGRVFDSPTPITGAAIGIGRICYETDEIWQCEGWPLELPDDTHELVSTSLSTCYSTESTTACHSTAFPAEMEGVELPFALSSMSMSMQTACGVSEDGALHCLSANKRSCKGPIDSRTCGPHQPVEVEIPTGSFTKLYATVGGGVCGRFSGEDICTSGGNVWKSALHTEGACGVAYCYSINQRNGTVEMHSQGGTVRSMPLPSCSRD